MIAWVDHECKGWGAHKLWLMYGEHGWCPISVLGRLMVEGPGAGHAVFSNRVLVDDAPECYQVITCALQKMANTHCMDKSWNVIHAHYLVKGKAKMKAPQLGMSVPQYWNMLHAAHAFIAACDVPRGAELSRQSLACA